MNESTTLFIGALWFLVTAAFAANLGWHLRGLVEARRRRREEEEAPEIDKRELLSALDVIVSGLRKSRVGLGLSKWDKEQVRAALENLRAARVSPDLLEEAFDGLLEERQQPED